MEDSDRRRNAPARQGRAATRAAGVDRVRVRRVVSPNGKSLAFLYFTKDAKARYSATDIVVATLDGQVVKRFPYLPEKTGTIYNGSRVQWSRDGAALYYNLGNLWKQPLFGGSPAQVTHVEASWRFDWSFDGKALAYSCGSSQNDVVMTTNFH